MAVTKTTTVDGTATVDKFTGSGTTTWTPPAGVTSVTVLVVGGGGGGGGCSGAHGGGGGGGAGAVYYVNPHTVVHGTTYTVTVGAGGAGGAAGDNQGTTGSASVFDSYTAAGGGGGGSGDNDGASGDGLDGGSGGGAGGDGINDGGSYTGISLDYGKAGGSSTATGHHGGCGGGGCSTPGEENDGNNGGNGGSGRDIDIVKAGTYVTYGSGGGGGSIYPGTSLLPLLLPFTLGASGEGALSETIIDVGMGDGTGSGGAGGDDVDGVGEDGSDGIVVIRYIVDVTATVSGALLIGTHYYGYKPNTLNIENRIGERGLASFQVTDGYILGSTNNGYFIDTTAYPIYSTSLPAIGRQMVFDNPIPSGISTDIVYYVVSNNGVTIQISSELGGSPTVWTTVGIGWDPALGRFNATWTESMPFSFSIGEQLALYVSGDLVWSGVIERINRRLPGGSTKINYHIQGVSWNYACDKRRVVNAYSTDVTAGLCAGTIVEDIIDKYLAQEGISTGTISTGAALGNVVFNYIQPSKCLDVLAEQSGYIWQINPDKTLDFKPYNTDVLTFNVGSTEMLVDSIQYTETNPKYRNVQYVTGGMAYTDLTTETQYGDSTKISYMLPYPIMKVPTVVRVQAAGTSSTQSVGILGVGSSEMWFWNKYSNLITQNTTDTPLSTSEKLKIVYTGGYKSVASARNDTAITSRRSVEGGSGIVEDVLAKGQDSFYTDNVTLGAALVSKYSTISNTLTFRTLTPDITPGKILKVTFPEFGLSSEEMLVDSVTIKDQDASVVWYNISALTGPEHGGWSKYFDDFMTRTIEKDIWADSVGDVISISTDWSESFVWTEAWASTDFQCPVCTADTSTDSWLGYPTSSNEGYSTNVAGYPC